MQETYDYIFWYNYINKTWYGIPRDNYLAFFGKGDETDVIKGYDMTSLIRYITK